LNAPLDDIIFTPLESESSSNVISGSSLEDNTILDAEDILRSKTETVLPSIDYWIDLSHDFSTQSPPDDTLNNELHPDFPTPFLLPPDPSTPSSPLLAFPLPPSPLPLTPDPTNLTIRNLSTFRGFATIASAIGALSNFHNLNYLHTLSLTPAPNLPPDLHPTSAQITIPHHPLLDILP
jgi:hypothetical protein